MTGSVNRILVADDDPVVRRVIQRAIEEDGWAVQLAADGHEAWRAIEGADPPRIVVLDWSMPGIDGIDICRRVRGRAGVSYVYLLMLTARADKDDVVRALDSGADDYLVKPFHPEELRSRIRAAERIIDLESALEERVRELEAERKHSAQLEGLLPICMHCKRIRNEGGAGVQQWEPLEQYIGERSEATFTHSLCDECLEKFYPDEAAKLRGRGESIG